MSEPISAVICTKDEEANIEACIRSCEGVDEVVIADDGSTDRTKEIAESLGARVLRRNDEFDVPTEEDICAFEEEFGWEPLFTTESQICQGRPTVLKVWEMAQHDWLLTIDADERVSWDLPRVRTEVLPHYDQVICDFVHAHDADGNPLRVSSNTKLFRRSASDCGGRTHSALICSGRVIECGFMRVDHWQIPREDRHHYVAPILEYAVLIDRDQRSRFYLGREYYYRKEYDKALALLNLYLQEATWQREIAQARLYAARSYWESVRGDDARRECLEAVMLNPEHREALHLMSELYYEPWSHKWAHLASVATDEDILF